VQAKAIDSPQPHVGLQRMQDACTSASYAHGDNHTRQRFYSELQHILGPYFELCTIM